MSIRSLVCYLGLGLLSATVCAAVEPMIFPNASQRVVRSKVTGLAYEIFVSQPATPPPPEGFPVIYLLDANTHFRLIAELVRVLAIRPEGTGVGSAIIVGIGYPEERDWERKRRVRDYTPAGANVPESGGAETFFNFIQEELKPVLNSELPINQNRQALWGHSVGGIFVLHTLFSHPEAFQTYIALSPSIWWGNRAVLRAEASLPERLARLDKPRRVFFAAGEFEQKLDPARAAVEPNVNARLEKLRENRMIDDPRELAARLNALGGRVHAEFTEYVGENHGSIVPVAAPRALPFFLRP